MCLYFEIVIVPRDIDGSGLCEEVVRIVYIIKVSNLHPFIIICMGINSPC